MADVVVKALMLVDVDVLELVVVVVVVLVVVAVEELPPPPPPPQPVKRPRMNTAGMMNIRVRMFFTDISLWVLQVRATIYPVSELGLCESVITK